MEFWDNSQAHKDDIVNFIHGRKEPSRYANGQYVYWVGLMNKIPFSLIMTIKENRGEERPQIKDDHLSVTGSTYSIEFMIGEKEYFGKGLGAKTLEKFTLFFQAYVDENADTFFIDPDLTNSRAKHVYENAGFKYIGDFIMGGDGVFAGRNSYFLVKKLPLKPELVKASLADYPTIQNMARFYGYDMSRECGFISAEWAFPQDGLYECHDFKKYFIDKTRKAYLVKIGHELAGFVLLHQVVSSAGTFWDMGEFYIVAKFQGHGIGAQVASQVWKMHPGQWEVTVIPENRKALVFWRKVIANFTHGKYKEEIREVDYDKY
ncbi:MAG: GNAT family N-acetyltransferase, partial [Candidatus Paceibacterales bacterium]